METILDIDHQNIVDKVGNQESSTSKVTHINKQITRNADDYLKDSVDEMAKEWGVDINRKKKNRIYIK